MKKIYNSPIITIVKLRTKAALMEPSLGMKNADATGAAMSREGGNRNASWDDDED